MTAKKFGLIILVFLAGVGTSSVLGRRTARPVGEPRVLRVGDDLTVHRDGATRQTTELRVVSVYGPGGVVDKAEGGDPVDVLWVLQVGGWTYSAVPTAGSGTGPR